MHLRIENVQRINSIENVDQISTTSSASSPSVVANMMRNDIRWHFIHRSNVVNWCHWFMMDGVNGRRDVWLFLQVLWKHVFSDHTAVDEHVIGVVNDLEQRD